MSPIVRQFLMDLPPPWMLPNFPLKRPGLAAWYDTSDRSTMLNDAGTTAQNGEGVKLLADKSGNSAVNALVLNGVVGSYGSFPALTAFGTGDFSVSARVMIPSFLGTQTIIGGGTNSFALRVTSVGTLRVSKVGVGDLVASTGTLLAYTEVVAGYTRTGTTGVYYINGVASGTITDSNDYTAGVDSIGRSGGSFPLGGNVIWGRVYSTALTAPEMLADAAGTVQANVVFNQDFSTNAKLATSVTASTGQTVTINTTGATGARISGARDLVQMTAANQPVLTVSATGNFLTFDGSNDYLKAASFLLVQPETVYFVGSQVTWTSGDYIYGPNVTADAGRFRLYQTGSAPEFANDNSGANRNNDWPVGVRAVVSALFNAASPASGTRVNQISLVASNTTGGPANGFTLGAHADETLPSNITFSEGAIYANAQTTATQDAFILYAMRKWGIQ